MNCTIKLKKCANAECGNNFQPFKTTDKYCSFQCAKANAPKPKKRKRIPHFSTARTLENKIYTIHRAEFLKKPENKICFIEGCKASSTTIEHIRGRVGYADPWARERGITLFLDRRHWAGCCLFHNLELERDPVLSKKHQLSKIHGGKKI